MMSNMDPEIERVMQLIRDVGPVPTGPVTLSAEYRRSVAWLESLPFNQDGSDKSWVARLVEADRAHFAKARPV